MSQPDQKHEPKELRSGPAKWVIVVAVILMLVGIAAYVLSLDEAIGPVPESGAGVTPSLPIGPVPQTPPAPPVPPISPAPAGNP